MKRMLLDLLGLCSLTGLLAFTILVIAINTPGTAIIEMPSQTNTAFQTDLKTVLATDLVIQSQRDTIAAYAHGHQFVWGPKEKAEYTAMTIDLSSLERIRVTEIAQYNSLAEGPDTKYGRDSCLPSSVDETEDISREIGILNSYCI